MPTSSPTPDAPTPERITREALFSVADVDPYNDDFINAVDAYRGAVLDGAAVAVNELGTSRQNEAAVARLRRMAGEPAWMKSEAGENHRRDLAAARASEETLQRQIDEQAQEVDRLQTQVRFLLEQVRRKDAESGQGDRALAEFLAEHSEPQPEPELTDADERTLTELHAAVYVAVDAFQRAHRLPGLQHAQWRDYLTEYVVNGLFESGIRPADAALDEAIEAARGEYLTDPVVGSEADEAYQNAVSDVVAAIDELRTSAAARAAQTGGE